MRETGRQCQEQVGLSVIPRSVKSKGRMRRVSWVVAAIAPGHDSVC